MGRLRSEIRSASLSQWEGIENKPQFLIYTAGAFAGVWLTSTVLGAVDHVPLVSA